MGECVVTLGLKEAVRELLVSQLEFLQTNNIGLARTQPVQDEIDAGPQAVDIPGSNSQAGIRAWLAGQI